MLTVARPLRSLVLAVFVAALGCHAQVPAQAAAGSPVQVGVKLSADMQRRIELMIRSRSDIPSDYAVSVSEPAKSEVAGYDTITVTFSGDGKATRAVPFLLSADGKTLAQFNKFDLSQDPKDKVSATGRPARGGPPTAPVLLVGFDDLECPFCAKMNAMLASEVLSRYKGQVRMVYRDFPLEEIHPWAKHAAIDADCLGTLSTDGYWNLVDYVHAHADEIAGAEKTPAKAFQTLDKLTLDEGTRQKVDQPALTACVLKQDDTGVKTSVIQATVDPLRIDSVPMLYVNGEKVEGVVPIETLYRIIDRALVAAGQTPPPPPPSPAPSAQPAPAATKPGS